MLNPFNTPSDKQLTVGKRLALFTFTESGVSPCQAFFSTEQALSMGPDLNSAVLTELRQRGQHQLA
ncbi:hypothetical protein A9258_15335 [Aeromonas hydrophila]|nr:hypothetical protein A9258_15335 [Aeromonas hydrophila]